MDPTLFFPAFDTVSSYAAYAPSIKIWGSAAAAAYAYVFFLPDNTPVDIVQKDNNKITQLPPVIPSGKSSVKSSVPVVTKNKIDLPPSLDLTTYRIQDLKPDRSFIRAFYFIRFNKDPSDEELKSFVETDIIRRFLNYPTEKMERVFYVMNFADKYEKDPYINFCKIRNAVLKSLDKTVTFEDVLKAAEASDLLVRYIKTTRPLIIELSNFIKNKILPGNAGFFAFDATKQQALIEQYGSSTVLLQLFNSLSALTSDKKRFTLLEECLQDECKNLTTKDSQHMTNDTHYKEFIQTLSNNKTKGEVNFPFRCGIGDMLANATTKEKVCVTYIKDENNKHLNYGCDDRNSLHPNRYIIYMDKSHHCVLLIPKTLAPSPKVAESKPLSSSTSSNTLISTAVEKKKANVSAAPATDTCKKYEDEYFSKGGRKRKQKHVTKRRQSSNRKGGRKWTKRI